VDFPALLSFGPAWAAPDPAGPQGFDNKMFGIAEAEAQAMDPHQRILRLATG